MAKTNRKAVDKVERKQRLAQRPQHDTPEFTSHKDWLDLIEREQEALAEDDES